MRPVDLKNVSPDSDAVPKNMENGNLQDLGVLG